MKSLPLFAFACFMLMSSPGFSQDPDAASVKELNNSFLESYEPDQNVFRGVRYFNLQYGYKGHKFFMEDEFVKGELILDNGIYNDVFMKYDLYDQQLILQAMSQSKKAYNEIIVTDSRLMGFDMDGRSFRKLYFPETDTLIFQVIGQGDPVCLYHWHKEVHTNSYKLISPLEFSEMIRKSYVVVNSGLHSFGRARSFAKIFPDHRGEIMKYIRREKIRILKSGDDEMNELINYCSNLTKQDYEQ